MVPEQGKGVPKQGKKDPEKRKRGPLAEKKGPEQGKGAPEQGKRVHEWEERIPEHGKRVPEQRKRIHGQRKGVRAPGEVSLIGSRAQLQQSCNNQQLQPPKAGKSGFPAALSPHLGFAGARAHLCVSASPIHLPQPAWAILSGIPKSPKSHSWGVPALSPFVPSSSRAEQRPHFPLPAPGASPTASSSL